MWERRRYCLFPDNLICKTDITVKTSSTEHTLPLSFYLRTGIYSLLRYRWAASSAFSIKFESKVNCAVLPNFTRLDEEGYFFPEQAIFESLERFPPKLPYLSASVSTASMLKCYIHDCVKEWYVKSNAWKTDLIT